MNKLMVNIKRLFSKKKSIALVFLALVCSAFIVYKFSAISELKVQRYLDDLSLVNFSKDPKRKKLNSKLLMLESDTLKYLFNINIPQKEGTVHIAKKFNLKRAIKVRRSEKHEGDNVKNRKIISKDESVTTSIKSVKKHPENSSAPVVHNSVREQESRSEPVPSTSQGSVQSTEGFNFNNKHYNIKGFSGVGHVPVDSYIYQWLDYPDHLHLLAERQSPIGKDIRELTIGSKVTVNGRVYTIFNVRTGVPNDENAYNILSLGHPTLSIQSCDSNDEHSTLTIWYAS